MFRIREAEVEDAVELAIVAVDAWRSTYHGLVSSEHLDGLSYEQQALEMESKLAERKRLPSVHGCTLVVEEDGRIVGYASGGPIREPNRTYDCELYAIYLLKEYQRRGLGRRLTAAIADRLAHEGHKAMLIWVLEANLSARRFYERLGGDLVQRKVIAVGGQSIEVVGYGWADVWSLVALD